MNDKLNEILKESNLTKLKATLVDFIDRANPYDEDKILDFIEGEYLDNYTQDENYNKYRVSFLQKWIAEERQRINERDKKLRSNEPKKIRKRNIDEDFKIHGLESLKITVTPQYFIDHVKQYRKDLSEIDFAKECLSHKERQIEIETQYNNFNALIFYKYYRDIIKDYLTSKGWENPIPKEKYNYIFKDDSYQIHEKYCKIHSIDMTCRTDLRALYDFMKEDHLLNDLVELKDYIQFIKSKLGYTDDQLKAISHPHSKPNQKRRNQYNAIKEATLKQP